MGKSAAHSGGTRTALICDQGVLKGGHRLLPRAVAGNQAVRGELPQGRKSPVKPPAPGIEAMQPADHRPDADSVVEPLNLVQGVDQPRMGTADTDKRSLLFFVRFLPASCY